MKRRIVIHCSGGPQTQKAADIRAYHLRSKQQGGRGWSRPGYHYVIESDGTVVQLVDEGLIANGAAGFNADSIHICYVGGVDASGKALDNRTPEQKSALRALVADICRRRKGLDIVGHRDLSPDINGNGRIEPFEWIKMCPSFDVTSEFKR